MRKIATAPNRSMPSCVCSMLCLGSGDSGFGVLASPRVVETLKVTEISTQTLPPRNAQVDGFVRQTFDQLDAAGIEYCLLRGYDELFEPTGYLEIDLLVNPEHLNRMTETTKELGFVQIPSWGDAPHYFFVAFNTERGNWIKLDAVNNNCRIF